MAVQLMPTDPNVGIPDLIHRLTDDSKRLVADEVRLAKLELHESVQRGGTGAMYLGIAFGVAVVAAVMLTLLRRDTHRARRSRAHVDRRAVDGSRRAGRGRLAA